MTLTVLGGRSVRVLADGFERQRMSRRTDDLRIRDVRPLIPPAILHEEIPLSDRASDVITEARAAIAAILTGGDDRLVVVAGPCSIHDTQAALDYATRLTRIADRLGDALLVVMRAYFEKPRTVVGWKGLINDPDLDGSYHINKGLRLARRLLLDVNELGLPTGSEFLDTQVPQHIADLTSWAAIGARTSESQVHREMASGLSMPVGFKNGTDGDTQVAIDAVMTARRQHWFPGVTKQGVSAILQTTGNEFCHVILRGGTRTGPNYHAEQIEAVSGTLERLGAPPRLMVDCSHGNSQRDHNRQVEVAADLARQIANGSTRIFGVMLESHLVSGRQDHQAGVPLVYGQSITDACLGLERTESVLDTLAAAVRQRRETASGAAPGLP
jgi:3-deoxy-7-phosphoheptulonate synthase